MKCRVWILIVILFLLQNQAVLYSIPQEGQKNEVRKDAQIEKGQPNLVIDTLGNIVSLPKKILFLNPKIDSHYIGPKTEAIIQQFIKDNPERLKDTKVRLNQWAPIGEFSRLIKNKKIFWLWRIFPGIPTTLFSSLTGRLLGGDHYNPFTNTVHIFSDDIAVALHELGHAKDMSEKVSEGTAGLYAVGRVLPPVTLYQEFVASDDAITYLVDKKERKEEMKSYNTLYPAYGTYLGSYSGIPYGDLGGAVLGHGLGFWKRYERKVVYSVLDNARVLNETIEDFKSNPLALSLIKEDKEITQLLHKTLAEDDLLKILKKGGW